MKQYYETVEVSELPPVDKDILGTSIVVTIVFEDGGMEQGYFEFNSKIWIHPEYMRTQPVAWLRPVDLSELIREVADKSFDAGFDRGVDQCNVLSFVNGQIYPDKETFINSLIK